ncbi:MAG TPA: hypothetical protein VKH81_02825, partial [Candidatus Angelobacter sp.]|nr:hypothetical protein [Candidatus Angelobacter sp.]
MADQNDDKRLDDLLDSGLSAYSAVEPRPGLEARILARTREAGEPQARWWSVRWVVAGAVAMMLVVLVLSVLFLRPPQRPQPPVQVRRDPPVAIQPQPENSQTAATITPV